MKMGETGKLIECQPRTGNLYEVPAWGFLEAIEVRFTPPLENMDAGKLYALIIEPFRHFDQVPPFQVFARVRNAEP